MCGQKSQLTISILKNCLFGGTNIVKIVINESGYRTAMEEYLMTQVHRV